MKPQIQYTKSGNISIAYQVFGNGNIDLVYIPGWISNIDWMWSCPELVHFFHELGKVARVILFDKRGTGLSDRVVELSTLEERMEDIKAVMDAVNSSEAVLFGHSEGGSVSALFSATYPNRVLALMAFGIFAKRRFSEDYPWAPTDDERQKVYDMIENNWGSGKLYLQSLVPSKANDPIFMDWLANYFRSGASPSAAIKLTKMNTEVNIIDVLKHIKVPTLLMQRTNDIDVKIEEGRFVAERLKDAKFVEFSGSDHLFWAGNTDEVLNEMKNFIDEISPQKPQEKGLITLVCGCVSEQVITNLKPNLVKQFIEQYDGKTIVSSRKSFVAAFRLPGRATNCAIDFEQHLKQLGITASFCIFMRQGLLSLKESVSENDKYIINNLKTQSKRNGIYAIQTIKHLLSGSAFQFKKEGAVLVNKNNDLQSVYSVSKSNVAKIQGNLHTVQVVQYDSFLEDVLVIIEQNLENSNFGVDELSRKVGISERQLQRKLKELTGKTPGQIITTTRLNKAKAALLTRTFTISEVAFQYGFTSPSYFSKCFKKEFGVSPSDITE
ncbi:alpha/beta fold hydrolase [Winogradskyella jejuensis]|uniref:Pimeloyl-ACP methyl ester carboxylesterase n=1 Tax=Winogradskyella jejuensis TaxID=1089305 RepID=A0A1M5MD84_9FLAO|nr:alpha/beta fold hydrolase [Winogradskyella jejuensis]SHG75278.1 Pimeloyl-ACP methyl ester carboxylesterase [Winogradskyella jejuensis]